MRGTKRERIIRVLLNDPKQDLTKYRVSKLSDISIGWTMEYLGKLEKMAFIEYTEIIDKKGLFSHWVSISRRPRSFDFFVNRPDAMLKRTKLEYALTTYRAETLVNHYLFPSRTDLYINYEDLQKWKELIVDKNNGLVGKGNLRLQIYDDHVFYRKFKRKGLWLASIPQIMHDLKKEGGVCGEAFDMMVDKYVR